ncbi:DUF6463 family protein [Streptomyces sp. NBC_00347]|uniref:DUF6463 family protein n=1 Tax=Streptomyces sp. NBC_00347 TaxID=2975721 RepID=UPI00225A3889|nr:DUF6463 family protein [Streptomyces sp. NBC_00347]MCX5130260.1 DUF6463 family protein [Streptomyces sp. NBC_00347]
MSIGTSRIETSPRARTLTLWAGRTTVSIGVLHTALFAVKAQPEWAGWLSGDLHGADPATHVESLRLFWALPGGFAVPLILLGLLLSHMARTNQEVPRYTGWVLAAWVALAAWILEPSGFPLGLIPAALLILAPHHQSSPEPGTT